MKPLAYTMRPTHFDDIVGQEHLVGPNGVLRKMIEHNHLFSIILYGDPGCEHPHEHHPYYPRP